MSTLANELTTAAREALAAVKRGERYPMDKPVVLSTGMQGGPLSTSRRWPPTGCSTSSARRIPASKSRAARQEARGWT